MTSPEERLHQAFEKAGGATRSSAELERLGASARQALHDMPRARPWWADALAMLGLNLAMGLVASFAMSWAETQHRSQGMRLGVAMGWLCVTALGSVLWLRPGPAWSRWLVGGVFVLTSGFAIISASGFEPGGPFFQGMGCALAECAVAIVPVAVMVALSMRFAATTAHVFSGALAAASGGIFALHFHCANGTVAHLVVFHLLPAVAMAGLLVGIRRLLRPKTFVP